MAGKYAKLLGIHKNLSDTQILAMLQQGSIDIEGTNIQVVQARRNTINFDDPYC
ncbi:hypothetical protein HOC01_00335 [archaeon]|jgi:hypothetical protein|nr:hypothetical protein [archaeon]MBT6698713.1 hypothetical protein [archaeon]